ncbi:hypothetical protein D9613_004990 [Agrocybe pediades]|uniref:Uncharacterized protein n=1 Tax=Agrocybe pediades TaxID=84607 RepID=A0A8H4R048_9AGAR|nr:hypothetical protein D9613_004990 [Agrocybe pediades]
MPNQRQPASRLTRNDLYSYGFKEGQNWGDDRRALEAALWEIDQHEREIRQNYTYNTQTRIPADSRVSYSSAPRGYSTEYTRVDPTTQYLSQARPPPDFCINRSDPSESQSSGSESLGPWSGGRADYYRRTSSHEKARSMRPSDDYSTDFTTFTRHEPSGSYGRASVPRIRTDDLFPPSPPMNTASSSYGLGLFSPVGQGSAFDRYNGHDSAPTSPHNSAARSDGSHYNDSQLVRYSGYAHHNDGYPERVEPAEERMTSQPHSPSAPWSVTAARDTISQLPSNMQSREPYAFYHNYSSSPASHAHDPSHVEYRNSYHDYGMEYRENDHFYDEDEGDSDHDFMSDGIASDEGEYYSSSEGTEEDYDGEEAFSDEGYYSSHSDDFYDSD